MKVGRNDPCPCGSGHKYKHCCAAVPASSTAPADLLWSRLRRILDPSPIAILKFVKREFGVGLLDEAWNEFTGDTGAAFDPDHRNLPLFMPWFFHKWVPDPNDDSRVPADRMDEFPVTAAYLRQLGTRVDPLLARYLQSACRAPFSYFEIVSVVPGERLGVRDIFTGREFDVTDRTASTTVQEGWVCFGQVVTVDHISLLEGVGPIIFPPIEKLHVLDLRKQLARRRRKLTANDIADFDLEMLDLYHEVSDRLLNPAMPTLQNTDGEPVAFCRVTYEVESARAAFDALHELCLNASADELLQEATRDAEGKLLAVDFSWLKEGNAKHASWENTVLGQIKVDGRRVVAHVNSEERAKAFRSLADALLPAGSRYVSTVIESMEAALESRDPKDRAQADAEADELNARPEVRAMMAGVMRKEYADWIDTKLPALSGLTPRLAMRTADGRERVEALLKHLEQADTGRSQPVDPSIFAEIRAELVAEAKGTGHRTR